MYFIRILVFRRQYRLFSYNQVLLRLYDFELLLRFDPARFTKFSAIYIYIYIYI